MAAAVVAAGAWGAKAPAQAAEAAKPPAQQLVALDAVVGIVGDTPITRYEVMDQLFATEQALAAAGSRIPSRSVAKAYLDTIVNKMIDDQVLLAKAKDFKIDVPDLAIATHADEVVKQTRAQFPTEQMFRDSLQASGLGTPDDYRKFLIDRLRSDTTIGLVYETMRDSNMITPVNVSEAQVAAEFKKFLDSPNPPRRPATMQFRQLIIAPRASAAAKVAAKAKAESLLARIKAGASFDSVAKRESMDPSTRDGGGDLGFVPRGKLLPEFDRVLFGAFALLPGEIAPVTETALGFNIIQALKGSNPTEVHARYILIRPTIDSADIERIHKLADSLVTRIKAGVPFDTLAGRFNDYAGGEDAGLMQAAAFDSLPESYRLALAGAKVGDVVDFPIATAIPGVSKYAVAQVVMVEPGGLMTLDDARERLRAQLSQAAAVRRVLDQMRKQIYIKVDMGRVYSILDELPLPPGR